MKIKAVLPILDRDIGDKCVQSILMENSAAGIDPKDLLIIDNTKEGGIKYDGIEVYRDRHGHNIGVSGAWNIGARRVVEEQLDFLVIMSASLLFGPGLHTTWTRQMSNHTGYHVIENTGNSWHLIAFKRIVFETIGYFDENFYPAYFEAVDFARRLELGFPDVGIDRWANLWCNVMSTGIAQHIPLVDCPAAPLLAYYKKKWGGDKQEETFTTPYGNQGLDYWEPVSIPRIAAKYKLDKWW